MTNFKGTKGNWEVEFDIASLQKHIKCGNKYIAEVSFGNVENNSNAKLIACAPEMMKEIEETITDLKILRNQISFESKTVNHWVGMPELIDKWIERKEQLIKKATE